MNIREDAIYGRQSVDRKDSISIESQIEFCKYELRGGNFRQYTDKGYSGKNTDRPKFQELMADIKRGLIKRVVVYKLDRISRSILDFATMMETFQAYNVEFVSSTEKFDTSTPMGRAMLNICIVFAQLERETIQKRVTDAYYSRCQRGFHMSGAAPFGFQLEPTTIQGIRTKMMKPDPETADIARLIFEMYAQPSTSFGEIARHFADEGILIYDKELTRGFISQMLRNPIYDHHDTVKLIQCGMVPYAHDLVHGAYDPAPGEQVSNVLFKLKRPGGWARRTKLLPILSMSICVYSVSQSTTLLSTYLSRNFCTSTQAIISAHSLSLAMACSSSEI